MLKGCLGLVTALWVASAYAQPAYMPRIVNNPTPQAKAGFGTSVAGVGDVNGAVVPVYWTGFSQA
ncbi:lysozyme [Methylocaldum marinum]|uniref:Lysozyme n=1 Tax=Methylocaldum marinum TaxID=1432792 RepID=A0A250KQ83_9GAMM|nr:lysozyme [Methylocaldum marinum]